MTESGADIECKIIKKWKCKCNLIDRNSVKVNANSEQGDNWPLRLRWWPATAGWALLPLRWIDNIILGRCELSVNIHAVALSLSTQQSSYPATSSPLPTPPPSLHTFTPSPLLAATLHSGCWYQSAEAWPATTGRVCTESQARRCRHRARRASGQLWSKYQTSRGSPHTSHLTTSRGQEE